jgi:RNA polymerase sigma-70 factor, ECF subfamily
MSQHRHAVKLLETVTKTQDSLRAERAVPDDRCERGEALLLDRLRAGDRVACEVLVRRHAGWMLNLAQRYLKDGALAEDCVQEAFLQAFRSIGAFEGRCALKSWLYRIVVNAALMRLRSQRCVREQCLQEALSHIERDACRWHPVWVEVPTPQEILQRKQTCELVTAKLAELSDGHRIVLLLRDIQGFSTEEVARMLDITEGAVKVRLHRARAAFRALVLPVLGLYV